MRKFKVDFHLNQLEYIRKASRLLQHLSPALSPYFQSVCLVPVKTLNTANVHGYFCLSLTNEGSLTLNFCFQCRLKINDKHAIEFAEDTHEGVQWSFRRSIRTRGIPVSSTEKIQVYRLYYYNWG